MIVAGTMDRFVEGAIFVMTVNFVAVAVTAAAVTVVKHDWCEELTEPIAVSLVEVGGSAVAPACEFFGT